MRSLMGESCFEPDMLKEMLSKNKAELADAEARLATLESEKDAEAARIRHLSSQIQQIHDWAKEFDSASNDTKKMILARMIERITVDRHYYIVIHFFISPESFTGTELDFALDICTAVQEERMRSQKPVNSIIASGRM